MPLIDAHVHLYPAEVARDPAGWAAARNEPHWARLCTRRRKNGQPVQTLPDVGELLRTMDAAGVERAVLQGWYWEQPDTCAWQNRFYARLVQSYADRLIAFATLHPKAGREAALEELRRAQGEGLRGLGELSPHSQGYPVDDPIFAEVLAAAGDAGMPVNLHVTDPESRPYPGRVETPAADFLWLARKFPGTRFILAHWGGMLALRESAFTSLPNVLYDTAASPLLYGSDIWTRAARVLGAERVLFGSDYPLNLYPNLDSEPGLERLVAEARAAGMTTRVMGGNAVRLLGI